MMNYIVNLSKSPDAVVSLYLFANKILRLGITISTNTDRNITAYDGKDAGRCLADTDRRIFFWNHYRTSRPPGVPKTGNRQQTSTGLPKIIPQLCYILAHSQGWKRSMRKRLSKSLQSYMIE